MCFDVAKGTRKAKITTKDIHCLKVLKAIGTTLHSPAITSKRTIWRARELHKSPDMKRYNAYAIHEGLHSMKTFAATKEWTYLNPDRKVYHAMIPAGSVYWENKKHYVSDALMIVDETPITAYQWRKLQKPKRKK